jgi:hypothetical protein
VYWSSGVLDYRATGENWANWARPQGENKTGALLPQYKTWPYSNTLKRAEQDLAILEQVNTGLGPYMNTVEIIICYNCHYTWIQDHGT